MAVPAEARKRALLRAQAGAARLLACKPQIGSEDVARLIVEPLLTSLGWPVLDPRRVRRGVVTQPGVPRAQFVCFDRVGSVLAVFTTTSATEVVLRDFERWSNLLGESCPHALLVDPLHCRALSASDIHGFGSELMTSALGDSESISRFSLDRLRRVPAPKPTPPMVAVEREAPPPRSPELELPPARTWDPTTYQPEVETWTKPRFVDVRDLRHPVRHWWEVVWHCAHHHLIARGALPTWLLEGQQRPYFSRNAGDLRRGVEVANGWFVEQNLNAHLAHKVARRVLLAAGVRRGEFLVTFE